jgi:hypothetical protein
MEKVKLQCADESPASNTQWRALRRQRQDTTSLRQGYGSAGDAYPSNEMKIHPC